MNDTEPAVAVEQSGTLDVVPTVAPVQKTKDSGIVPVKVIWLAVLAATEPLSVTDPVVSIDAYVVIRTKNVVLEAVGLVMPSSW